MQLKDRDLQYIVKKLRLTPEIVKKLTEEERDADLLFSEAAVKDIKKEDSKQLTSFTYIKLVVFRYSYDSGFSFEEKKYVARCIFLHFLGIKKEINYRLIASKVVSENRSQYCLILSSFFHDRIDPKFFTANYIDNIAAGFRKNETLRDFSFHVSDWIDILREIHVKNWMRSSCA